MCDIFLTFLLHGKVSLSHKHRKSNRYVAFIKIFIPKCVNNTLKPTDKKRYPHNIFLISARIPCGYSELPASNEYLPPWLFSWRNKKNISTFWLKKHLIRNYEYCHIFLHKYHILLIYKCLSCIYIEG